MIWEPGMDAEEALEADEAAAREVSDEEFEQAEQALVEDEMAARESGNNA